MAEEVLTLADSQAAKIAADAQGEAAAIREAAEREAAATREAAIREAAELRAQLDWMYAELSRVTDFLAENSAPPIAPPRPGARRAFRGAPPVARPARPDTTRPGTRPARPATRPARPATRPAGRATKTAGRQAKAMRKFVAAFALVSVIGAIAGASELVLHGIPFFLFRANGAGASVTGPEEPDNPPKAGQPFDPAADQQPATQNQPTGKHHKPAATSTK